MRTLKIDYDVHKAIGRKLKSSAAVTADSTTEDTTKQPALDTSLEEAVNGL